MVPTDTVKWFVDFVLYIMSLYPVNWLCWRGRIKVREWLSKYTTLKMDSQYIIFYAGDFEEEEKY